MVAAELGPHARATAAADSIAALAKAIPDEAKRAEVLDDWKKAEAFWVSLASRR